MTANEHQVGGKHYKTEYEHWDLVLCIPMGYLEGNTTKYVSRARKKGGLQDYRKAMHYLDKLIECYPGMLRLARQPGAAKEVHRFALANGLTLTEEEYIVALCTYHTKAELTAAKMLLEDIINEASRPVDNTGDYLPDEPDYPGTPADGGHHAGNQ
jgi:hypothetical protein